MSYQRDCTSLVVAAASTSYCLAPPRRPRAMRIAALRLRVCCEAAKQQRQASAAAKGEAAPPKPHPRFSRSDLKRIKQQGPSVADLYAHFEVDGRDSEGKPAKITYDFVPPQVLGGVSYAPEPAWARLRQMPYMEFYAGLRTRNWTSAHHDPQAEPWALQFFKDSGRLLRPSWAGYRVLVTPQGGGAPAWVNLDRAGASAFLHDYAGGGGPGAIHVGKREAEALGSPAMYGYNQSTSLRAARL